jgi:hypothetical protein
VVRPTHKAILRPSYSARGSQPGSFLTLEALRDFVNVVPVVEPDHLVVEQLARMAHVDSLKAVQILDRLVRGDRDGWHIHGWQDSARMILELAVRSGSLAKGAAEELIDYLGRRGHVTFGELLAT